MVKLTDAIDRLFSQLVQDPWSRTPTAGGGGTLLTVDLPVGRGSADVAVALEGRRLVVRTGTRGAAGGAGTERAFTLPEGYEVDGIEARFAGEILQVRVHLRVLRG